MTLYGTFKHEKEERIKGVEAKGREKREDLGLYPSSNMEWKPRVEKEGESLSGLGAITIIFRVYASKMASKVCMSRKNDQKKYDGYLPKLGLVPSMSPE